ncbi:MAG: hypothetical protein ACP5QE_06835 [Conexivisphaera sp.]
MTAEKGMKSRRRNYKFLLAVPRTQMAPTKTPPLCDGCGAPFALGEDGNYHVTVVVLNNSIWGVVCPRCAERIKIPTLPEAEVPTSAINTALDVLSRDPVFIAF